MKNSIDQMVHTMVRETLSKIEISDPESNIHCLESYNQFLYLVYKIYGDDWLVCDHCWASF